MPSDGRGPSLSFDWEMALFRGLRALGRGLLSRGREAPPSPDAVALDPIQGRLTLVAQIVAGMPLRVLPSRGSAGLVGATIFLPPILDGLGSRQLHESVYLLRTVLAAEMARQGAHRSLPSTRVQRALHEGEAALAALASLAPSFPRVVEGAAEVAARLLAHRQGAGLAPEERLVEAHRRLALARMAGLPAPVVEGPPGQGRSAPALLWGELLADAELSPEERAVAAEQARPPVGVTTEMDAPEAGQARLVKLDQRKIEDATLMHTFEKVETADAFLGGGRDLDGTDELEEHGEALSEVPLAAVTRSDEDVHAVLRAEVGGFSGAPEVAAVEPRERGIRYDEWDARRRAYRRDFCTVYPGRAPAGDASFAGPRLVLHARVVDEARRTVEQALVRLAPRRRQRDGEQVDVDAMVRHLADLASGHATGDRLYVRRARRFPSMATALLVDVSLSSDAWIDDQRVLDVEKDAALVLGEVLEQLGESLEIFAFSSHTRNRCNVLDVRRRQDPWAAGKARLAGLAPRGYTRIGPALRHVTSQLLRADAERRLLLLLSDGKPTDYDRYEGRHGIEDVRQAVREAKQHGVHVHGLTLDARARDSFPAMFGPGHYHPLPELSALPRALASVYARLRVV